MSGKKQLIISGILAIILAGGALYTMNYQENRLQAATSDGIVTGSEQGFTDGNAEGADAGFAQGSKEGYETGEPEGYEAGLSEGFSEGDTAGYEEGKTAGYAEGKEAGYQEGKTSGYRSGESQGYTQGYSDGLEETVAGLMVYNPTYDRAMDLLRTSNAYTARSVTAYFEAKHVRSGYVWMKLKNGNGRGYELVAFDTIDKGIIIVLPRTREEMHPEVGGSLSELIGIDKPDFDDTISSITITW